MEHVLRSTACKPQCLHRPINNQASRIGAVSSPNSLANPVVVHDHVPNVPHPMAISREMHTGQDQPCWLQACNTAETFIVMQKAGVCNKKGTVVATPKCRWVYQVAVSVVCALTMV